ncbi:MAG: hypothetical protein ACREC5_06990 [Thermoplasmata archaeon]
MADRREPGGDRLPVDLDLGQVPLEPPEEGSSTLRRPPRAAGEKAASSTRPRSVVKGKGAKATWEYGLP